LAGIVVYNGLGHLTGVIVNSFNAVFVIPVISIIAVTGLVITYQYAPADAVIKPLKDSNKRMLIKELALAFLIIWYSTMMLIVYPMIVNLFWKKILVGSTLGIAWQVFTITPLGFKLFRYIDDIFNKKLF
jgi:accessory gene regulator B